jgi:hypothetical protein
MTGQAAAVEDRGTSLEWGRNAVLQRHIVRFSVFGALDRIDLVKNGSWNPQNNGAEEVILQARTEGLA